MSDTNKTLQIASKLIAELHNVTDELTIKTVTLKYWHEMKKAVSDGNFGRCRTAFRKAIQSAFPDKETATLGYYFTNSGKGRIERFEHLALWYATASEERWNVTGEDARKQYFGGLPELPKSEVTEIEPETTNTAVETKVEVTTPVVAEEVKPELTLESMNIEALALDTDTQQKVQDALTHSGLSLAEFIQKACTIYATTLTGKAKQFDSDLSAVPTQELLTSAKYKTHPVRAEELAKRAIVALENHNNNCTEKSQKWMITQTAIQSLIGSKPATVKAILENYKTRLDDHNSKHDLTPYDNRKADKSKIEDVINLVELVPDGIDL
ncbi:hypothetical protein VB713_11805 [Anabaena cylindrica UHCC 0172]|uniref:hypothetical protein n=1 Tax=Anabaena cylindrica TaxID=1165 RepID=UPI002B212719|nr:hypothetical protein [Anabaena cylindrica]MEA5551655.1 hypothetical protein [Anabaena cylindrica UHCC 0172]